MKFSSVLALALAGAVTAVPSGSRTKPPCNKSCLIVRQDSPSASEYGNISAAVTALGAGAAGKTACMFIYPGTYTERVYIKYAGNLTVYGYTTE